jgi:hypothetical protein
VASASSLVAPNEGLPDQLDYLLRAPISGVPPWLLMLWSNALVPDQDTVYAQLTEATFQGYSRITLSRATWTASVILDDAAVSTYGTTPQIWICTGSVQTIQGWAIITPVASVIRYIEPFPEPVELEVGQPVGVLPRVTLTTQTVLMMSRSRSRVVGRASKTKREV